MTNDDGQAIINRHDAHMVLNYPRYPVAMVRGRGAQLWDAQGKRYIDLFAGFGAGLLGHAHPDLVGAVSEQAQRLWHVGNLFHTEPQTRAAAMLAEHGFGGRSFFCHSGADANEAAFKLARLYGQQNPGPDGPRFGVISCSESFHGRLFATMAATGQPKVRQGFAPLAEGFYNAPFDDLAAIEKVIDPSCVAIIVEPIQGEGGVRLPAQDYLPALRRLCDQRDMLLIFDEVWTGCGRTGRWFAHQHWGVEPDIMTLAKGVGGGLPVGVMCASQRVAELFSVERYGGVAHATTLGANCLSMAATAAVLEVIHREGLVERAASLGESIMARLRELASASPLLKQVRGRGLFIGVELEPLALEARGGAAALVRAAMDRGVLINATQQVVLRLAPPLTITQDELDEGMDVLASLLQD